MEIRFNEVKIGDVFKKTESYMGHELNYITQKELIELGEWLIALGKGDN